MKEIKYYCEQGDPYCVSPKCICNTIRPKKAEEKKDLRGSGSKENVGRHKNPYVSKKIYKNVPSDVYDACLSLIDAEVLKFKIKNNIK